MNLNNYVSICSGGMVYWSPGEVPTNAIIYETNRPFIQPKNNEYWDSVAVEASAFALLTYLIRDGISPTAEKIVVWLHSMRLTDGSFIGTLVRFHLLLSSSPRQALLSPFPALFYY